VLPGTGGLTRLVDKRKVRRDLADVFCTTAEGVRADRARAWRLVDASAPPAKFRGLVEERARAAAAASIRPAEARGVELTPLDRTADDGGYHYRHVDVVIDRAARTATLTVKGPEGAPPRELDAILAEGARWWPLAMARELDDAILLLRTNDLEIGTLVLKTRGDADAVLASDAAMLLHRDHWFVRETVGFLRRTLRRLDVSSRSLFAVIDEESCFAGTLLELALAADRSYMLLLEEGANAGPRIALGEANLGPFTMPNGLTRLATRFGGEETVPAELSECVGRPLDAAEALRLGLVTFAPDELDWEDEVRLALEERASLSPDALTGMEASLRFAGRETMATRIFGRLTAWQNWIFNRPNAVGEHGALKLFGTGAKAQFNWERV
jgi:benzoyl-CoA-dihydrodiol lyase